NGDGTFSIAGNHTYSQEGNYSITATVSVSASIGTAESAAVVIDAGFDASPVDSTFSDEAGDTGDVTVATISDANSYELASSFAPRIDWGDGSTLSGEIAEDGSGQFEVIGRHVYANADGMAFAAQATIQNEAGLVQVVPLVLTFLTAANPPPQFSVVSVAY